VIVDGVRPSAGESADGVEIIEVELVTGDPLDAEVLDVRPRPERDAGPARRLWPVVLAGGLLGLLLLGLVRGDVPGTGTARAAAGPGTTGAPSASASGTAGAASGTAGAAPGSGTGQAALVTEVGHPLLGVTAGWELFGLADGEVVRVQPALGRVTRTPAPVRSSSDPVYFLALAGGAVIHPLDVPGYLVPDGKPAGLLPAGLGASGPMFPGPDPSHVWIVATPDPPVLALASLDGTRTGRTITIPPEMVQFGVAPDGAGSLLVHGVGGIYDVQQDGLHRITTGQVLATGPTGWLTTECDRRNRCTSRVVLRAGGSRPLPGPDVPIAFSLGTISPDGSTAALFIQTTEHSVTRSDLTLVDLASGSRRTVPLLLGDGDGTTAVWSPDSRWLFALQRDGALGAVDVRAARAVDLGVPLPSLTQLAVRS
jgi:hypothetical protein